MAVKRKDLTWSCLEAMMFDWSSQECGLREKITIITMEIQST